MKIKITKKEIKNNFNTIISVAYENIGRLLVFQSPFAYSIRAEGWACDYYDVDGICISTGYAPVASKNTIASYETCNKYNKKANLIIQNYNLNYQEKSKRVNKLLQEFINEVIAC